MKKIFILAGILAIITPSSTMLAAARQQPGEAAPRPHGGLLRVLFSCCCTTATVDGAIIALDSVHKGLEIILAANPGAVREIYLLCQKAGYALSDFTVELLQKNGFLEDDGDFKTGWKTHIKQLLTYNGAPTGPQGFHIVQCIQDLVSKHPDVVAELEGAVAGKNAYIDSTARLLNEQYGLTKSSKAITPTELAAIVEGIQKEKAELMAPVSRAGGYSTLSSRGPSHFRILEIDEATPGKSSDLFKR